MYLVARSEPLNKNEDLTIYVATSSPDDNASLKVQYLLTPKTDKSKYGWIRGQSDKPRPFFSPDVSMVFFHSNIDGHSQIFMATEYKLPEF